MDCILKSVSDNFNNTLPLFCLFLVILQVSATKKYKKATTQRHGHLTNFTFKIQHCFISFSELIGEFCLVGNLFFHTRQRAANHKTLLCLDHT